MFSNDSVGDFIVGVEAEATPPLPSPNLGAAGGKGDADTKPEAEVAKKKTRISSAAPLVSGAGPFTIKEQVGEKRREWMSDSEEKQHPIKKERPDT